MLDGVSLDQLRTLIAAAEEGNFSAAGRRLRRAQSVVSLVVDAMFPVTALASAVAAFH
jgi:hypothetical protein